MQVLLLVLVIGAVCTSQSSANTLIFKQIDDVETNDFDRIIDTPKTIKFSQESDRSDRHDTRRRHRICPGGKFMCSSGSCIEMKPGQFKCCPYHLGRSCLDGRHCCPQGFQCLERRGRCKLGPFFSGVMKRLEDAKSVEEKRKGCHSTNATCTSGSTCCDTKDGFRCCPFTKAVCCGDGMHCCPEGTTCDLDHGSCVSYSHHSTSTHQQGNMICPDKVSQCYSGQTCCLGIDGGYKCCPAPNATCCQDKTHCCPHGYKCDTAVGLCTLVKDIGIPFLRKMPSIKKVEVGSTCPDGKSSCGNFQTCCPIAGGGYGCCPLPKATCCQDKTHCCPPGYQCDTAAGLCTRGKGISIPLLKKMPSIKKEVEVGSTCPDGKSSCGSLQTCCPVAGGGYGCCPAPQATCCQDKTHCCPQGYQCDTAAGLCTLGRGIRIPFLRKKPSIKKKVEVGTTCPDGKSSCGSLQTCCPMAGGGYGCCPSPQAVCCSDGLHCCPHGYVCDTAQQLCIKKATHPQMAIMRKKSDLQMCPDGITSCFKLDTCCKAKDNSYECCPFANATCCSGGCCPHEYSCGPNYSCKHSTIPGQFMPAVSKRKGFSRIAAP